MRTSFSLVHEARLIYTSAAYLHVSRLLTFQLQAEHQHAAALIDLLFKRACN